MLNLLVPGCNGVIPDYKSVPPSNLEEAFSYISSLGPSGPPPEGDELYDPQDEFGGQGMGGSFEEDDTEGGGDFDHHFRDEL